MSREKSWYKKWWGIIIIIIFTFVLIILVAIAFYFYDLVKNAQAELSQQKIKLSGERYDAENKESYWIGSAKPLVTIVEFADFACPYSKNSFPKIRDISLKYKNQIKFIYRDYPLLSGASPLLALSAHCAGEQGLFWLMHDKLFENQGVTNITQLAELANQIGANITKFNSCIAEEKYLPKIQKDVAAAQLLGISGTPAWFINGYKLEGDIPYNMFIQIIESLLGK